MAALGRPRKNRDALAADTDKPISLYLPIVQILWLNERGKGPTLRQLILDADRVPPPPGEIEGDSAKDGVRMPPDVVAKLDRLVAKAAQKDRAASRAGVVRALVYQAMHGRRRA